MGNLDFILIHAFTLDKEHRPNEIHRQRLNHGLMLYQKGLGKNVIVTSKLDNRDRSFFENTGIPLSKIMKVYLIEKGVPEEEIYEEPEGENTYDCTVNCFKEIIIPLGWDSGVIVSSAEHLPRVILQTRKIIKNLGVNPLLLYSGLSIYDSEASQEVIERFIEHERQSINYSMKGLD